MTTLTPAPAPPTRSTLQLATPSLPRWAPLLVLAVAAAGSALVSLLLGWHPVGAVLFTALLFIVGLPLWSRLVEDGRRAKDRLMTSLVWSAFVLALVPLVSLVWTVVSKGLPEISAEFLTYSMRNVIGDQQGGIYHAIIGTLLITAYAALISIPIGIFCAIYLVEYGATSRLAGWITFLVDVMTGIPSIVAGLFAYALFVLFFGDRRPAGLRRLGRAVAADDPGGRPLDRGDAEAGAGRAAGGGVRPRCAEVAHRLQGRAADRDERHRHRRDAGDRPGHRRDRAAADHRRQDRRREHQHVRRRDDHPAGVHLLLLHPARAPARGRPGARMGRGPGPDHHRDGPEPAGPCDRQDLRSQVGR